MTRFSTRTLLALLIGMVVPTAVYVGSRAIAEGVPPTPTMYYSGVLEEDGGLLTGTRNMSVALWTTEFGGTGLACSTTPAPVEVEVGNFRVPLSDGCVQAVRDNPELWAEVTVGAETLPRTRLGAVPYAIEAEHAVSATTADSATEADHASTATSADSATTADNATTASTAAEAEEGVHGFFVDGNAEVADDLIVGALHVGWEIVTGTEIPGEPDEWEISDAICPVGTRLLGGGCLSSNMLDDAVVSYNGFIVDSRTWRCMVFNTSSTYYPNVTPQAICARIF